MSTLGFSIDISKQLSKHQASVFSQWIGSSNVIRNQKIIDFKHCLSQDKALSQSYSFIKKNKDLSFLNDIPVQILRNSSSLAFRDAEAARKGIRKFPKIKPKHKKRNCLVTKELFFIEEIDENNSRLCIYEHAKKKRNILFSIKIPYIKNQLSNQFYLSRQGNNFRLSGSFNNGIKLPTNEQLLKEFSHLSEDELTNLITGVDRGVVRPIQTNRGLTLVYSKSEKEKLRKEANKIKRYQRILARKKRLNKNKTKKCESKKQHILKDKIAKTHNKIANIRDNACHHWSKELSEKSTPILSLESLMLKNMTKKAKPKRDKCGRKYVKNNANAKSGLNRAILNVSLGKLGNYTKYKLNHLGKAWVEVDPKNTSKIHFACQGKNTERPKQNILICHDCQVTVNADDNASDNIAFRAIKAIKEQTFSKKKTRQIKRKRTVVEEQSLRKKSKSVDVVGELCAQIRPCANAEISPHI